MRAMTIEALRQWTFEELLKRQHDNSGFSEGLPARGWDSISAAGDLMASIGDGRRRAQRYAELWKGGPHPDAIAVENAVKALADLRPILHDDPSLLLADMPKEVQAEAEEALKSYRVNIVALVTSNVVLKRRPGWRIDDIPRKKPICLSPTGGHPTWFRLVKTIGTFGEAHFAEEQCAIDPVSRRPPPGSYRKYRWSPSVSSVIDGRADWMVWIAALDMVSESVAENLTDHRVRELDLSWTPWIDGIEELGEPRRVLPAIRFGEADVVAAATPLLVHPQQKRALR
jgi:hypothetical protein